VGTNALRKTVAIDPEPPASTRPQLERPRRDRPSFLELDGKRVTYVLVLRVSKPVSIRAGGLGERRLSQGLYLYVGSARKAARSRLRRHLLRTKPLRWHIDYLTTSETAEPLAVLVWHAEQAHECAVAAVLSNSPEMEVPIPGFGSSDCRAGCPAHLFHLREGENLEIPLRLLAARAGNPLYRYLL